MPILRSNETGSIWGGAGVVGHEKLVVDGGAVHIDADDSEHVIRIIHEKDDGVDILAAIDEETDTKTVHIDSGGTYHTIGRVRNSGWSGKATSYSITSFQIGAFWAASIPLCGMPSLRACSITSGSLGSRKIRRWAS